MAKAIKITKDMLIADVVTRHPETIEVFQKHGMGCFGCAMARMESIEDGVLSHGIDVAKLVKDLNKAVKEG